MKIKKFEDLEPKDQMKRIRRVIVGLSCFVFMILVISIYKMISIYNSSDMGEYYDKFAICTFVVSCCIGYIIFSILCLKLFKTIKD